MASHEVVLYSCIVNRRDRPKRVEFRDNFRYVLFTDEPDVYAPDWEVRPLAWGHPDPVRVSRYHKHHAFELFPDAEYAIWLDMTHWAKASLTLLLTDRDLTLHRHEARKTAKEEAEICATLGLDDREVLLSQYARYVDEGFPDDLGLFSTSCLVMRNTDSFNRLSAMWWEEISKGSRRDQVSLPYCLWKTGIRPGVIPGVDRGGYSPYFKMISHYKRFVKLYA